MNAQPDPADLNRDDYAATYCPEDNKLRLYTDRVERSTFLWLRAIGFTATPKQSCSFVATWTPSREDAALSMIGEGDDIGDEDQTPEDRAADRAERFAGYREKRRAEAGGLADRYDGAPSAYGAQNAQRAERQAARRDRVGARACSQWSKAEYWQTRTAGVIAHALHRSDARTRRGRILKLEAEQRQIIAEYTPADDTVIMQERWNGGKMGGEPVPHVLVGQGRGRHFVPVDSLETIKARSARWLAHYDLRLTYERAMLENEGGTAAAEDMQPGGLWKGGLITKVNKSNVTGAVVSVLVHCPADPGERYDYRRRGDSMMCNVQRYGEGHYTPPTPETLAKLAEINAKKKARTQARNATAPKLLNPTDEDAQALQDVWNEQAQQGRSKYAATFRPGEVLRMTQAEYAARSKGDYSPGNTVFVGPDYKPTYQQYRGNVPDGAAFKVRRFNYGSACDAYRVIVITDKPQKPLPARVTTPVETPSTPVEA